MTATNENTNGMTWGEVIDKFGTDYSAFYRFGVLQGVDGARPEIEPEDQWDSEAQWDFLDGWVQGRVEAAAAAEGEHVYEYFARYFTNYKYDVMDMVRYFLADLNTPTTVTIPSAGDPFVANYADTLGAFLDGSLTASQYLSAKGA